MKKTYFLLLTFALNVTVSISQQLRHAPVELLQTSVPNQAPTVNEIFHNFQVLMANPDTTLNHAKKVANRWMHYEFPKYNIIDSNEYNAEDYREALKAIYSSDLFCGNNDLANWISDGPADMPDWIFNGREQQNNGWVDAIYADPNNSDAYLLGTRTSGIMKTTDGGDNWNSVTDQLGFPVLGIQQIIAAPNNPNYLLAITGTDNIDGGVIYSTNGGDSWAEIQQSAPQFQWLDFHPTIDGLVFATATEGVMYSFDYGLTWQTLGIPGGFDNEHREFFRIVVLNDKFFVTTRNYWVHECFLFRGDFTVLGSTVNNTWSDVLNTDFAPGEYLKFIDFSNKPNNDSFYLQTKGTTPKTFVTNDGGNTFTLVPIAIPINDYGKNELIASPNDPNIVYWGAIQYMKRYNLSTGAMTTITPLPGNNGHHDDYRCSHIINDNGKDKISFGNDGGTALVVDGLSASPKIQSLNGENLSINLIHAFNVHEKTGRIAFAFQDHAMRYRDANLTYSSTFLHEGSGALVQQLYPNAIVGEWGTSGIRDKDEIEHPIVQPSFGSGATYLGGYFTPYRHFPNRFARGLGGTTSADYGKVAMNRGVNISEVSPILMSHGIGPVAICERNPDFIYAADQGPFDQDDKFYRSTDDGDIWVSLINSLVYLDNGNTVELLSHMLTWNTIRAIAVDHFDGNKVYCGIGRTHIWNDQITDERFRVIKSLDGGTTFVDYSEGLPALPVERLLTIESDNELIFCATSVGVYYRTKSMSQWECYSKNLPKVMITGMQYDYCNNNLYVSTYGRGLWKTEVNIPVFSSYERLIDINTLWDEDFVLAENVVVKSGFTLEITANVYIQKDKQIIVEPGAKLIVDGGRLTSACSDYWQGIEVQGNSGLSQLNQSNQGVLITRNNATIEYAINAIRTIKNQNGVISWNKTGGIVSCSNTTFKNNRRSCEYLYYHAQHPSNSSIELLNKGRFTNCTFTWDDDYTYPSAPVGITMFHINGVQITGCDFEDTRSSVAVSNRATGIGTIDAGYKVLGRYTGLGQFYPPNFPQHDTYNETNYDISHFTNLKYGIQAMNSATFYTVTVDHTSFLNNSYGIVLDAVDNAVVTRNKFSFDETSAPDFMTSMYELSFRESSGYLVEGNKFIKNGASAGAAGTIVLNSGPQPNQIYRNSYDGVNVGNWGIGFNSNDLSSVALSSGLQWKCNSNLNGYIDMLNQPISYSPALDGEGVRLLQGSIDETTGNTLSPSIGAGPPTSDAHFFNGDQDLLAYFYGIGANEEPTETQGLIATVELQLENNCPSTLVNRVVIAKSKMIMDAERPVLQDRVLEIDQELAAKSAALETLLINGDATYLHDLVHNLSNQNKNQVKATLLSQSPYLSQALLEELGQKQPNLFPHPWYRDIINANIEVARNDDFMNTLTTKPHPMPPGMYNQINDKRYTTFTVRGEKELEILRLSDEREVLINLFIADAMSGEEEINWDEVKQYLIHRDNIECKRQIADYHLSRENVTSCTSILDLIELQLSSIKMERVQDELENFVILKRYLIGITNNTGIIASLNTDQIAQFVYMAENFKGKAARQARNILCFHANLCEDIDYEIPESVQNGNKSMPVATSNSTSTIEKLSIVPNPHDGNFQLGLDEGCQILQIVVHDIKGTEVQFEQLKLDGNKATIQLNDQEQGIYIVSVRCDDGTNYMGRSLLTKN